MKTHVQLYLTEFSLELEMFQPEDVKKIRTHVLCLINFF